MGVARFASQARKTTGTCVTHEAVVRPAPPRRLSARILAATRNTCRPFGLRGGGCEGALSAVPLRTDGRRVVLPTTGRRQRLLQWGTPQSRSTRPRIERGWLQLLVPRIWVGSGVDL